MTRSSLEQGNRILAERDEGLRLARENKDGSDLDNNRVAVGIQIF